MLLIRLWTPSERILSAGIGLHCAWPRAHHPDELAWKWRCGIICEEGVLPISEKHGGDTLVGWKTAVMYVIAFRNRSLCRYTLKCVGRDYCCTVHFSMASLGAAVTFIATGWTW
ncbi:hypothetical protein K431DRAFT_30921 [Polychaeton citri CBS 116435]|uniref:Uncharacterized protein n=1 Tax=Polychaeton citri CBS 116435 TaxID=1314669 RepID=A0A9P4QE58_9PEZI|nr:hypothetical protein K431DRAFT_30921 [Polychaeton citri CBS 116435]